MVKEPFLCLLLSFLPRIAAREYAVLPELRLGSTLSFPNCASGVRCPFHSLRSLKRTNFWFSKQVSLERTDL
ncbi:hypothetical protein MM_0494 [Methanosarcina mazei Go1]|uniref:Uncharacterized protein n=1 Tax=Methanosarcina mazei (strain ATCC BAA-159 / DSM 3647 / Goe1 / Go1 / JCM 11833 / OCM 88) TaxID=192952 RepID=Q8PZJ8_METMA|nr:hypothetical protein MM_0494 [Methanosarcina mazei Go1]